MEEGYGEIQVNGLIRMEYCGNQKKKKKKKESQIKDKELWAGNRKRTGSYEKVTEKGQEAMGRKQKKDRKL